MAHFPHMRTMVLECLPTFARTKSPSFVGKSTMHGAYGFYKSESSIWVNYNISLTWIKAIWGWFPLLTMIPVRSQWGRYNLPMQIYFYGSFSKKIHHQRLIFHVANGQLTTSKRAPQGILGGHAACHRDATHDAEPKAKTWEDENHSRERGKNMEKTQVWGFEKWGLNMI